MLNRNYKKTYVYPSTPSSKTYSIVDTMHKMVYLLQLYNSLNECVPVGHHLKFGGLGIKHPLHPQNQIFIGKFSDFIIASLDKNSGRLCRIYQYCITCKIFASFGSD